MKVKFTKSAARNLKLAKVYGLLAMLSLLLALSPSHFGWLALWPATALAIVAAAYSGLGVALFRKQNGSLPLSTRFLLAPFLTISKLAMRWLARSQPAWVEITPNVLVGRRLSGKEAQPLVASGVTAVLDVTTEFSEAHPLTQLSYLNLPILDHTAPTTAELAHGAAFICEHARNGKVYVHCALGYSRSVAMVAAFLLAENLAASVDEAVAIMTAKRPCALVTERLRNALTEFHAYTLRTESR